MRNLKEIGLLILSLLFGYLLAGYFGDLYGKFFILGGYIDATALIGLPLSYIFFLTLLFTALPPRQAGFGGSRGQMSNVNGHMSDKRYWWIGIGLIPAAAFELYFDLAHIYFPIALGVAGWVIGMGISKVAFKR